MTDTHWVCEFRNGFYLQTDAAADSSGLLKTAKRFESQSDADTYIRSHEGGWIALNGGVEKRVATCAECGLIQPIPRRSSKLVSRVIWFCDCFAQLQARCP